MANYTENIHSFNSSSPYCLGNDHMWESIDLFMSMNTSLDQNPNYMDSQDINMMIGLSTNDYSLTNQITQPNAKMFHDRPTIPVVSFEHDQSGTKKRKVEKMESSSLSLVHSSPSPSSNHGITSKNKICRAKRAKRSEKKTGGNHTEVVHVRARRGQATDSHSIAERVRRGKINERLQCLKDIVPGCYKTMGMAVMLDEIINYVQSLKNQVEFLSMKLTAASQFHEFNVHTETIRKIQRTIMAQSRNETQDWEKIIGKAGYDQEMANFFQPTWPF